MPAGKLRHRVAFEERQATNDRRGNRQDEFVERFVTAAEITARLGGEAVSAARLSGKQPVNLLVRQCADTRRIQLDWRARDMRSGKLYDVVSIVDPDDRGMWISILCETASPDA